MQKRMKKIQNSLTEESTAEASESVKKLHKSITDVSHYLDDQRGRSLSCKDLFTVNIEIQRLKLKSYCERMIFADPSCYGRKAEEIMWRKTYHDVYSTAKILKKNNIWNKIEVALLENHFQAGIGCYYNILFKFQTDTNFEIPGLFDFFKVSNNESDISAVKKDQITLMKKNDKSNRNEVGIKMIIYRCLICLGDLTRYLYELNKLDLYYLTARRYYKQALLYKPDNGLPHNQIGRLALTKNNHMDAIYHYIRCVFSVEPFEGGKKNLLLSLQQISENINNSFLVAFFTIVDIWYNEKDSENELNKMYSKIITYFKELCSNTIKNKPELLCNNVESLQTEDDSLPSYQEMSQLLTNENIFKIVVIITTCLGKLHKSDSKHLPKAELFFFTLTEQMITQCLVHYSKTLPQLVDPFVDHAKLNRRRRRRGFTKHSSPDSQDWSEGDEAESVISPDDDSDDDESEEEMLIFDIKNPNDDKNKNESDGSNDSGTASFDSENKKNKIQVTNFQYAETIHIIMYWIKQQISSTNLELPLELLTSIVKMLNYMSQSNIENDFPDFNVDQCLLPEEEHLIGMTTLWESKGPLSGMTKKCYLKNQDTIRIMKILCYAKDIALNNVLLTYNSEKKWFSLSNTLQQQVEEKSKLDNKRDKQHVMGQLWLRSEVDNLEVKMKYTSKMKNLPTCIVLDTEALINHSLIVKKLVNSAMFIVVVPAIVISALDEQKKLSKEVRLTIRWLEFQLQQGNCNLKSQGIHESKPIKVEGTAKLTKEMCHFKHILECCNYFTDECGESNGIVTLITGSDELLKSLEMMQMAKSIKINIEHIKKFQMQLKMAKNKG